VPQDLEETTNFSILALSQLQLHNAVGVVGIEVAEGDDE
jgi:hypothetical protein